MCISGEGVPVKSSWFVFISFVGHNILALTRKWKRLANLNASTGGLCVW